MKRSIRIAACLALLASAGTASAGSPYERGDPPLPAAPRVANPAASGVPNVPDLQGCVKWCERDMNPCDPPVYKQADGRCNYLD